jgi:hypothetical protein
MCTESDVTEHFSLKSKFCAMLLSLADRDWLCR